MSSTIYIGDNELKIQGQEVSQSLVNIEGENFYKISNVDAMRPFFMSVVSDSNHWMFISSNGGLSAGRKDCDIALFPYYTDDKITESVSVTGSKTILQIHQNEKSYLWEPFSENYKGLYAIEQNLYKSEYGNKVLFEEVNHDLGLSFRYQWSTSNRFGFVKTTTLINNTEKKINITVLDGLQNMMPYGINADLQNNKSNLADAYKKSELETESGLGIYALSAIIVDKAEPSEALKATIAWCVGLESPKYLISSIQLNAFRKGQDLKDEKDIRAEKCAYFVCTELGIDAHQEKSWRIVSNVNQGPSDVKAISTFLRNSKNSLDKEVSEDIALGTRNLIELAGAADGLQLTADELQNSRHFSNVLFNIMRGGVFDNGYEILKSDFVKYIAKANKDVYTKNEIMLEQLSEVFSLEQLRIIAGQNDDTNFKRLCLEYMPLKFSRRHGDPSRPWNKFSINTSSEIDGSKILDYEGNWRDIFQNWEALAHSYPEFIESMIHKFLNATTFDGYNPYRVTKDGFDWEVIEPNDPWSYIGYWGDHQIAYLLKFLEFIEDHFPNRLATYFDQDVFVYANVPYKIKVYEDILLNPKDTITFDHELEEKITTDKKRLGADGALLSAKNHSIYNVNLIEKLLATVLAKCSNFIPEGGIWLNTQRPEWNDANNALVGNGVSMVTLYYLRRFLKFFEGIVESISIEKVEISVELADFFNEMLNTLEQNQPLLSRKFSDTSRKLILDALGRAGSTYRTTIYENGFTGSKKEIARNKLLLFVTTTLKYLEHSIDANKREDNLYHAYNLMTVSNEKEISIAHLNEMLEGQVAVLSSGHLSSQNCLELLDSLKNSALFRSDQYSYLLYPDKELSRFMDKNNIPAIAVEKSTLLERLIKNGNTQIIEKDLEGNHHFNGNFNNATSLANALSKLSEEEYGELIKKDKKLLLDVFEEMFDHKSFTGRSGTFFGYEGLGSIYWHMVSKLLLAVQECCLKAISDNEDDALIGNLLDHYYEINAGIGVHKSPELYGAFTTDPYSHTPGNKGAQQPGMTGQVKEDILSRMGELGIYVKDGEVGFGPGLLRKEEFLKKQRRFSFTSINKEQKEVILEENSLCFTYCQIPIVYKMTDHSGLEIFYANNTKVHDSLRLDKKTSAQIFRRTGEINKIVVSLDQTKLY